VNLEKASIDILAGARAGERLKVLFNPFEYGIERANTFKSTSIPGLSGPLLHFINGEADVLSLDLFLDDYTDPPRGERRASSRILDVASLLEIDRDLHAPPPVQFVWGKLSFKAIIEKLSRKITMFHPDGTPARATLTVTFKEYKTLPELVREPGCNRRTRASAGSSSRATACGRWRHANTTTRLAGATSRVTTIWTTHARSPLATGSPCRPWTSGWISLILGEKRRLLRSGLRRQGGWPSADAGAGHRREPGGGRSAAERGGSLQLLRRRPYDLERRAFVSGFGEKVLDILKFGATVEVGVGYGDLSGLPTLISGIVTEITTSFAEGGTAELTVAGYDHLFPMTLGKKSQSWAKAADSDVVSQLAQQ